MDAGWNYKPQLPNIVLTHECGGSDKHSDIYTKNNIFSCIIHFKFKGATVFYVQAKNVVNTIRAPADHESGAAN